jgi:tetratricopeptide (TPR) repeat protein
VTDGLHSVRDAAELFGVPEARLRYWAQTGFVGPTVRQRGRFYYTFQDLVALKVAIALVDGGVPLQRVRRNLDALRERLPQVERPLAELRVLSDGEELVVVEDGTAWQPASGQLVLSFAVRSIAGGVRPLRADTESDTAYGAFLSGLAALDAGDPGRAEAGFRRAVALDAALAAAWTNLGNLLEARGERGAAREAYEKALALDPEQPEARYDLANLLLDAGDVDLALAEYRRVVQAAPGFADAQYNLGVALLAVGAETQARAAFSRYLELDPGSEWAERAAVLVRR